MSGATGGAGPGRADLLALTPEVLATLTNRGLVKRALKAVDAGELPALDLAADGSLRAEHPDGTRSDLPSAGGLADATCSCAAVTTCRHVLAAILAYQRRPASADAPTGPVPAVDHPAGRSPAVDGPAGAPPVGAGPAGAPLVGAGPGAAEASAGPIERAIVPWSPGEFTDRSIEELIGVAALVSARRSHRAGYTARVCRPTAAEPVPRVELATCTVRFLVPHQLGYAHCDAAVGTRPEAVALAVWAFREADERAPGELETQVEVGGGAAGVALPALDRAVELAGEVLLAGAVNAGPGLAGTLAVARRDLDLAGLRWPVLAVDELARQLEGYRARDATYRPTLLAEVLAELPARHRAVTGRGASPRSRVLGTEEPAETLLRRVRLVGLGARVVEAPGEAVVEVFLAQPETGTVLVLPRRWAVTEGVPTTGHDLSTRRLAGSTVAGLAGGNLITESAVRSASRRIRLASPRVARTTVSPGTGDFSGLPAGLLVTDLAALDRVLAAAPPRLIRPRVDAEAVRVVALGEVLSIGYAPGEQRLDAVVTDPSGGTATVSAGYRGICPGALDALAAALAGMHGPPRFVTGAVRRTSGGLVVEALAVASDGVLTVPDLAPGDGGAALQTGPGVPPDPVSAVLTEAAGVLAEAAHAGLRHLPATFPGRLRQASRRLDQVGLGRSAAALAGLVSALGSDPGPAAVRSWVDAQIRVSVTAERR